MESTSTYWTKVWLIALITNKSIVIAYETNIGEIKKIRIHFFKSID